MKSDTQVLRFEPGKLKPFQLMISSALAWFTLYTTIIENHDNMDDILGML